MTSEQAKQLRALADRVEVATKSCNSTDVQCEVAMFQPDSDYSAVRANAAGTKVIYTDRAGHDVTCWAEDWTTEARRISTAAALRSHASLIDADTGEGRS